MNRKYWCTLGGIRSFESLRKEAKTLEEILEDVNLEVENAKKRVGQNYAYSYRGQLFNERWVRLDVILGLLAEYKKQLQEILDEYTQQLIAKTKAGPPSDYQDLWFLCKQFRDEVEKVLGEA